MELRWVPSNNLAGMIGQKKEMFYLEDGTVRYAGTFEASRDVCEYRTEEYRNMAEEVHDLIRLTVHLSDIFDALVAATFIEALSSANSSTDERRENRYRGPVLVGKG